MNRRAFVQGAMAAGAGLIILGQVRSADAQAGGNTIDVGTVSDYANDGVFENYAKKPQSILVVRQADRIFAISSLCTHNRCVVALKDGQLECPCHKSQFQTSGKLIGGRAKASLFRHGITRNDAGRIIVDKSKQFGENQWEDAAAFIKIT